VKAVLEAQEVTKRLMNVKEVCEYTGWGATKVREVIKNHGSTFSLRLGNRIYVDKDKFDKYLDNCIKYGITII
jgi:excisionase family DNA binding protein